MSNIELLVEEKRYEEALEILTGLYRDNPGDFNLLKDIATVLYLAGDFENAESYFSLLYEKEGSLDNLFNLVLTKFKLQEYHEVLNLAGSYINEDKSNLEIFDVMGDSYYYLQDYDNALECYNRALEFGENSVLQDKVRLAGENLRELKSEKSRLLSWADEFYKISRYGPEKRKNYGLNYPYLFKDQVFEVKLTEILLKYGFPYLSYYTFLDVGCGEGRVLRKLLDWGANPENLFGIDLHQGAIEMAVELSSPKISFSVQHADELSFPDHQFDIIMMIGVLQHVLDKKLQAKIAGELKRVLKPNGIIITLNINKQAMHKFNNAVLNENTVGIDKDDLEQLFPECRVEFQNFMLTDGILFKRLPPEWATLYTEAMNPEKGDHDYGIAVISR